MVNKHYLYDWDVDLFSDTALDVADYVDRVDIANQLLNGDIDGLFDITRFFVPSDDGIYRFSSSFAKTFGFNFSFSFQDILTGYSYYFNQNSGFSYSYDIGSYQNGVTSNQTRNFGSESYVNTYSASNFYDVGEHNGYLSGYDQKTGVMNFVNIDISSWERESDYVSFDMGNGTSFQAQTSSSTDDIFQYSTDGQNIHYAKLAKTNEDSTFGYSDGVVFIGTSNHEDTLNLSTYDRSVDLRNGDVYINVDNIDASSTSSRSYYQRNLIGNNGSNQIWGGHGDLLWGGMGDDVLYGGSGGNTYKYGLNEGNDTVWYSTQSDKFDLYNVSLSDISSYGYNGSSLKLNMQSGESLTIMGNNGASNFVLADKSEYSYNRSTDTWTQVN